MDELTEKQNENQSPIVQTNKSRAGLWLGIIAIVLTIALAIGGFYFIQQLRFSQDSENNKDGLRLIEMDKEFNGLQNQLSTLQSQIANINVELTGKDNHFSQTLTDFSKLHEERLNTTRKELESSIFVLQRQLGKTRGDWLLADAEYLLTVANQRLHLVGDVNTTREALEAADQRLRESGDASVFKVREQLAKEITLLSGISAPDIVGLYGKTRTLQDQVEALTVFLPHSGKELPKNPEPVDHGTGWFSVIAKNLEPYIVVRHSDQAVTGILTPEEAHFIKQQMKVRLEMIEIALVQQNDALFTSSIADAQLWLKKNFAENQQTEQFISELEKLNGIQIRVQFPDVSLSLKMLKDISKLRVETDKAVFNEPQPATETTGTATPPPPASQP